MSALQKLQEKIEEWKKDHEALKLENSDLKTKLAGTAGLENEKQSMLSQLQSKTEQVTSQEEKLKALTRELEEKDEEIEKIIAQVESLLA